MPIPRAQAEMHSHSDALIELDHIFICTSVDAADEIGRLLALDLTEGTPNTHPGQGTACRRFFFPNGYLELLWVNNPAEAQSEAAHPTRLWERWTGRREGACPFGFGFRRATQQIDSPPFATWEYRPPYLPEPWNFQIGQNSDVLTEPMLVYLPFAQRPDSHPCDKRQPLEHSAGLREISSIELVTPHAHSLSNELAALAKAGLVRVLSGAEYFIELALTLVRASPESRSNWGRGEGGFMRDA